MKKYNNFKHILNKVDYELLKCDYCNFVWQKYTPDENFSIELYENIIEHEESF